MTKLRFEMERMNQDFEHKSEPSAQVSKLQSELDALRDVYAEANETIMSLRQSQVNLIYYYIKVYSA